MEVAARHRPLIEYDRRGKGVSQREVDDLSLAAQVNDLIAVTDALDIRKFDLVGGADGAAIAISYAAKYPDRVPRLVLPGPYVGPAGPAEAQGAVQTAAMIRSDWSFARRAMATVVFPNGPVEAQRWWSLTLKDSMSAARTRCLQKFAARTHEDYMAALDVTAQLSEVKAPTLVLHFSDVRQVSIDASMAVATSIPDARFVPLQGGFGTFVEHFDDVVLPFLDEGAPARPAGLPSGTAIILFADIVDSTALTERLGDAAFREKARDLDTSLRTIIRDHAGTPIEGKLLGDGVLATFTSGRQALEAARACGRAGDEGGLPLHLGLHAGDVISEEGNVFGGAVNIAARISGESAPGEVLVSQTVRDLARTSAGVGFEDAGERELKGVSEPVRVWSVRNA